MIRHFYDSVIVCFSLLFPVRLIYRNSLLVDLYGSGFELIGWFGCYVLMMVYVMVMCSMVDLKIASDEREAVLENG